MSSSRPLAAELRPGDGLLIVDVQNDFLPGGALAVRRGEEVVGVLNAYLKDFLAAGLPVFATRDWHPADHCSFTARGGPWPPHCVAGSQGADFAPDLRLPASTEVISKATGPHADAYSGFQGTDLEPRLRAAGVDRLFIGGLATDYCVLETVKDACARGFAVFLLEDAVRAVEVTPGDGERALSAMRACGAVGTKRGMVSTP